MTPEPKFLRIAKAIRRADAAIGETGYTPLPEIKQPPLFDGLRLRRYRNGNGDYIQIALSVDELLSPPDTFGLMLKAKVNKALSSTFEGKSE